MPSRNRGVSRRGSVALILAWMVVAVAIFGRASASQIDNNINEIGDQERNSEKKGSPIVSDENSKGGGVNEGNNGNRRQVEFRSNKVQQIWEKAKKKFDKDQPLLEKLKIDLHQHDLKEVDFKKAKFTGLIDEGAEEAKLRKELLEIMAKFGLAGQQGPPPDQESVLKDSRLRHLWDQAQSVGYDENDLRDLMQEFIHHQEKLEEYALLRDESSSDNRIEMDNKTPLKMKHPNSVETDKGTRGSQRDEMMDLKQDIHENLQRLELKAKKGNFTEVKADFLWRQALQANFTDQELMSLMDELKHFEQKVKKHEHYKREANRALKHYNIIGAPPPNPNSDGRPPKHEHLRKKEKDLLYQVKKMYGDFSKKISSGGDRIHNEL